MCDKCKISHTQVIFTYLKCFGINYLSVYAQTVLQDTLMMMEMFSCQRCLGR